MALIYDEETVAYLRLFFERRIEFFQEISTWLERVDASQIQVLPGKIELNMFLESFKLCLFSPGISISGHFILGWYLVSLNGKTLNHAALAC